MRDLVHLEDRERVGRVIERLQKQPREKSLRFRILNHVSGETFVLNAAFSPRTVRSRVAGWFICAEIRAETDDAAENEAPAVRPSPDAQSLFSDLASQISGFYDTEQVTSHFVQRIGKTTGADGACWLSLEQGGNPEELSLLATAGAAEVSNALFEELRHSTLLSDAIRSGQSEIISDVRTEPRLPESLVQSLRIRSLCIVPISVEARCSAIVVLSHTQPHSFSSADAELVIASGATIALAAREAALVAIYRKQTKNLSALYRLSRELSTLASLDTIFARAFTIIREELGFRRLWIGLLNEANTRIVGQAAYGPGWKRRLIQINVELAENTHPIARVVSDRRSLIIQEPDRVLKEFGSRKFFSRFSVSAVGLVPLISAGQMLGVLAFQPDDGAKPVGRDELALVSSLAAEIANAIFARQLDQREGEAEKMRAAGLLAAGIAHNFNNVLQGIIGQASLIEMHELERDQQLKASKAIAESAEKGATLVRQLSSFANLEEPHPETFDLNALLERHVSSLRRILSEGQKLKLSLAEKLPKASADSSQMYRILQGLIRNASEASGPGQEVEVFTDEIRVEENSPQYEVPFGSYVRLGVRDLGIGMSEEIKMRCFEPFFSTKDIDPGSGLNLSGAGLGLSSSFTLARKNGGRLVVESQPGQGSVFTLYMPVAEPSSEVVSSGISKTLEVESYRRADSSENSGEIPAPFESRSGSIESEDQNKS